MSCDWALLDLVSVFVGLLVASWRSHVGVGCREVQFVGSNGGNADCLGLVEWFEGSVSCVSVSLGSS